jgi:hypothetical protein
LAIGLEGGGAGGAGLDADTGGIYPARRHREPLVRGSDEAANGGRPGLGAGHECGVGGAGRVMEIDLPEGVRVRVDGGVDEPALRRVLSAVRGLR